MYVHLFQFHLFVWLLVRSLVVASGRNLIQIKRRPSLVLGLRRNSEVAFRGPGESCGVQAWRHCTLHSLPSTFHQYPSLPVSRHTQGIFMGRRREAGYWQPPENSLPTAYSYKQPCGGLAGPGSAAPMAWGSGGRVHRMKENEQLCQPARNSASRLSPLSGRCCTGASQFRRISRKGIFENKQNAMYLRASLFWKCRLLGISKLWGYQ